MGLPFSVFPIQRDSFASVSLRPLTTCYRVTRSVVYTILVLFLFPTSYCLPPVVHSVLTWSDTG